MSSLYLFVSRKVSHGGVSWKGLFSLSYQSEEPYVYFLLPIYSISLFIFSLTVPLVGEYLQQRIREIVERKLVRPAGGVCFHLPIPKVEERRDRERRQRWISTSLPLSFSSTTSLLLFLVYLYSQSPSLFFFHSFIYRYESVSSIFSVHRFLPRFPADQSLRLFPHKLNRPKLFPHL